jgi:uncharacterized membrane protein YqjE
MDTSGREPATRQDASVGELVKQLSDVTSRLVRQEAALARVELREKGKEAARGAGLLGAAGMLAVFAFGVFSAFVVLLLSKWMDSWLAALIVAAVYAVVAGVLALVGKRHVQRATPPAPEQATESVKEDVQWAKTRARSART